MLDTTNIHRPNVTNVKLEVTLPPLGCSNVCFVERGPWAAFCQSACSATEITVSIPHALPVAQISIRPTTDNAVIVQRIARRPFRVVQLRNAFVMSETVELEMSVSNVTRGFIRTRVAMMHVWNVKLENTNQ